MLLHLPSSMHADANTPAETGRCSRRSLPSRSAAFPYSTGGSASAINRFEACSAFTRVSACMVARAAQGGPSLQECFSPCRYLHEPPWPLPAGATVAGWVSHPPGKRAFPRRTEKSGLGHRGYHGVSSRVDQPPRKAPRVYFTVGPRGHLVPGFLSRSAPCRFV